MLGLGLVSWMPPILYTGRLAICGYLCHTLAVSTQCGHSPINVSQSAALGGLLRC